MKSSVQSCPAFFLSAHGDVDMAVDAIEAGAVTFLSKPVRTEKLLAAIERALTIAQSLTYELRADALTARRRAKPRSHR